MVLPDHLIPMFMSMDPMPDTDNDIETRRRRAYYRATHRGTKEMDWLLGRFAEAMLGNMDGNDLDAFEEFLAMPEPDIEDWLLTPGVPAPDGLAGEFVAKLKLFHDL
jgi:antitoxin CptB